MLFICQDVIRLKVHFILIMTWVIHIVWVPLLIEWLIAKNFGRRKRTKKICLILSIQFYIYLGTSVCLELSSSQIFFKLYAKSGVSFIRNLSPKKRRNNYWETRFLSRQFQLHKNNRRLFWHFLKFNCLFNLI